MTEATLPTLRASSEDPISLGALKAYQEGQPLPTLRQIEQLHVLNQVKFPGVEFRCTLEDGRLFLRVVPHGVLMPDGSAAAGRKWRLSPHMTDGELVQTAFLALTTWQEHERRELFTFLGASVFNPHFDIYKLVDFRRKADAVVERD